MGDLVSDVTSAAVAVEKMVLPSGSTDVATLAGVKITACELETATTSFQAFGTAFITALAAKNYVSVTELTVDEALTIAKDTGLGGTPIALAALFLPVIFDAINSGKIPMGTLADNAGETQETDVQSTIGIGRR